MQKTLGVGFLAIGFLLAVIISTAIFTGIGHLVARYTGISLFEACLISMGATFTAFIGLVVFVISHHLHHMEHYRDHYADLGEDEDETDE